jgi:hypothetical protein
MNMERNKLDLQIKQKLQDRAIQPSAQAWDRLEAMLDTDQKTKKRSKNSWITIAASFIGFVFIATAFYNYQDKKDINTTIPVVLEQKKELLQLNKNREKMEVVAPVQVEKQNVIASKSAVDKPKVNAQSKGKYGGYLVSKQELVAAAGSQIVTNKVADKIESKMDNHSASNKYITAAQLLAEVSNSEFDLKMSNKAAESSRKMYAVDANSLLSTAETELNQSFRESALKKINKNFNAVKTALVNRNYQE